MPQAFVEGRRPDGSPNCSHAWARTVDGIQGDTWPQVHLLGTAALQHFTGYTGQSRSQQATHNWNVARLPEIDHGGVVADQRTPEQEVLDALRRHSDTGFAIHDASRLVRAWPQDESLFRRADEVNCPAWLDRVAEVARPPLPGHDPSHGIDLRP